MNTYNHTQRGPVHLILYAIGLMFIALAWSQANLRSPLTAVVLLLLLAGLMIFLGLCFHHLTVRDEGVFLAVRYGPLPVFKYRITYESIVAVETAHSDLLDGLGIHYLPGRGWIFNLWGKDCVKLELRNKTVRIGSDDAKGLLLFLQNRISS
ncbi:MAG: DUF751 domain-containing protein [Proteobacteria bacterium]|nr:DUF751 domain-containing protein [Pseudomonadota bacterium]MBU1715358.1 DUF751 domain-containing protein [Pseudomonadota bacterium]